MLISGSYNKIFQILCNKITKLIKFIHVFQFSINSWNINRQFETSELRMILKPEVKTQKIKTAIKPYPRDKNTIKTTKYVTFISSKFYKTKIMANCDSA